MQALLIKDDGLGDLILASGLIAEFARQYDGTVDLATSRESRDVAEAIPGLHRRFYTARDALKFDDKFLPVGLAIPKVKPSDQAALAEIGQTHYDQAFVLRRYMRHSTFVVAHAVRSKEKWLAWQFVTNLRSPMAERFSRGWRRYSGPADVMWELDYYRGFLEHVTGLKLQPRAPQLELGLTYPIPPQEEVLLVLGGNSPTWPWGNWVELAKALSGAGHQLVLIGGVDVERLGRMIVAEAGPCENLIGTGSLREVAARLAGARLCIANDTGMTHLALSVGAQTLIIQGGGTFRRFFPWPDQPNQHIIYHRLECFDCAWRCKYKDFFCLSLIAPLDVLRLAQRLLAGQRVPEETDLSQSRRVVLS